jgi:hypothetical protein
MVYFIYYCDEAFLSSGLEAFLVWGLGQNYF